MGLNGYSCLHCGSVYRGIDGFARAIYLHLADSPRCRDRYVKQERRLLGGWPYFVIFQTLHTRRNGHGRGRRWRVFGLRTDGREHQYEDRFATWPAAVKFLLRQQKPLYKFMH